MDWGDDVDFDALGEAPAENAPAFDNDAAVESLEGGLDPEKLLDHPILPASHTSSPPAVSIAIR
jgi:hypothetical protein